MRLTRGHHNPRRVRPTSIGTAVGLTALLVGLATMSSASVAAPAQAPTNTAEPAITGTPMVGRILTSSTGSWTGSQPITFTRQWVRCDATGGLPDGSNCSRISGATRTTYELRNADVGFRLRVRVNAANSDGSATATSNPTVGIVSARPVNSVRPSISGSAQQGNRLQASRGTWTGEEPMTFGYRWLRCNTQGDSCSEISGATDNDYVVQERDVGRTLRVRVTARNDAGSSSASSQATGVVQPSGPSGVITLPSGERSIPATSVSSNERLIVSQVEFSPNPVTSRQSPITVIRVTDTRGFVVRDALVFIRATPRVTTGGNRQPTATDGWVTYQLVPNANFPQPRNGFNVQYFVKAYRAGDPPLAGVAAYRLVQVRLTG